MRIAIPLVGGRLSMHFGRCEEFVLIDLDAETKQVVKQEVLPSPPHEPGLLPSWLHEKGADVIITGGMGPRAQDLFGQYGIKVVLGAPAETPDALVASFAQGALESGENPCDH